MTLQRTLIASGICLGFALVMGCDSNRPVASAPVEVVVTPVDPKPSYPSTGQHFAAPIPTTLDSPAKQSYPSTGVAFWDPVETAAPTREPKEHKLSAEDEQRAIALAREYLETESHPLGGADFSASRTREGYSVFVVFGNYVGAHCLVQISDDWKVVKVIPGL